MGNMQKVLAVSGGVDSMVMLEMLKDDPEVIVAHFDHGTRESSKADAEFVERECEKRGVKFVLGEGKLGEGVSEERARAARYEFLESVGGEIYAAHHLDDVVESVAINLLRGTGWRGLAPMGRENVRRPLVEKGMRKKDVLRYAAKRGISFRQDPTNTSEKYLRNRVREKVAELSDEKFLKVIKLVERQKVLKEEIEKIIFSLLPEDGRFEREWFLEMDDKVALEILRAGLARAGISTTRPQREDFLAAIRTYKSGKEFNLPGDRLVKMQKDSFML